MNEFWSNLYHVDALIRWGGPTVLAIIVFAETGLLAGFFLPGDSLLVTAGLMASREGGMNIWWLVALLSVAAIAGDSTGYVIGYHLGARLFRRDDSRFFKKSHLLRTQRFYERHGAKMIVLARFAPILRTVAPTIAGGAKMRYRTFVLFNVIGGITWATGMTLCGYFLGRSVPDIEQHVHWVIAIVFLLSLIPIVREWIISRRASPEPPSSETDSGATHRHYAVVHMPGGAS